MNGLLAIGLIFLIIALAVYPRLTKEVEEGSCHQAYEIVENNKKYFKIILFVSLALILAGVLMIIV